MKYLYTNNATIDYNVNGQWVKFKAIRISFSWVGVLKCNEAKAEILLRHKDITEVDEEFYENALKKKSLPQDPNRKVIQASSDSTKPVHAETKPVESVEVEEIEMRVVETVDKMDKPKPVKARKKK